MTSREMLDSGFATLSDLVRAHAAERPDDVAAVDPDHRLSWSELNRLIDRIAARPQQDGLAKGDRAAIAGLNSVEQMAVILAVEIYMRPASQGGTGRNALVKESTATRTLGDRSRDRGQSAVIGTVSKGLDGSTGMSRPRRISSAASQVTI